MTNFKEGDTVRVSWEIRTEAASPHHGYILVCDLDNEVGSAFVPTSSVELVKRRKAEVGDVVNSRLELQHLPINSVVVNNLGNPMTVRPGGTFGYHGRFASFAGEASRAPYRVVYIPE